MTNLASVLGHWTKKPEPEAEPVVRRALNANFRLGKKENAEALLKVALNSQVSMSMRAEALSCLRDWAEPPQRDRVTGFWRPLAKRDFQPVRELVEASLPKLLASTSGSLQIAVIDLVQRSKANVDDAAFVKLLTDAKQPPGLRIASLRLLEARRYKGLKEMIELAAKDDSEQLRADGRDLLVNIGPQPALASLRELFEAAEPRTIEKQRAFTTLARIKTNEANDLMDQWAAKLADNKVPAELQLDLIEVLKQQKSPKRDALVQKFEATLPKGPLGKYQIALVGGNAERGRDVFVGHSAAQCIRCHKVSETGGKAGPDLSKVVTRYPEKTREHFLESMILPNAKLAPGFASVTITQLDGKTVAGLLQAEDSASITIQVADGRKLIIKKADIEERSASTSPMPSIDRTLTTREIRDVIAYLMTLK
ncbi:MAG: c-type cytochrome [Planctomycetes bacterium]|nr:c-type cytochrome [Planctomycetota bacterium]